MNQYFAQLAQDNASGTFLDSAVNIVVFVFAAFVVVAFAVVSVVLNHHWVSHGVTVKQIKLFRKVYFGIAALLLAGMSAGIAVYLIA